MNGKFLIEYKYYISKVPKKQALFISFFVLRVDIADIHGKIVPEGAESLFERRGTEAGRFPHLTGKVPSEGLEGAF